MKELNMVINVKMKYIIISLILILGVSAASAAETTKNRKETYPDGTRKSNIKEYYNEEGEKYREDIEMFDSNGHYLGSKSNYYEDTMEMLKKRQKAKTKADRDIFNIKFGDKNIKIERKITDEPNYGSGCKTNIPNQQLNRDANRDYQRKIEEEKNGKPKGGYWLDMFNFLDDYACSSGVTVDKDNFDRKKTYRYRMSKNFDLKMQKWTPAAEYFLDKKKNKSVEFVFWDRRLTQDSGGPVLRYRFRF